MKKLNVFVFILCLVFGACTKNELIQEEILEITPIKETILTQSIVTYTDEFLVLENEKVGVINKNGELVIHPYYNAIYKTASGEYLGKKDQGYDLLRNYQIVEEFQNTMKILEENYDSYLFEISLGLWRVRKDGKRAYVDMSGKQLSETMFERISPISIPSEGGHTVASNLFASYEKKENHYFCAVHTMDGYELVPAITRAFQYEEELYCYPNQLLINWQEPIHGRFLVTALIVEDNAKYDGYSVNGTKLIDDADIAQFAYDENYILYDKQGKHYSIDFDGNIKDMTNEMTIGNYTIKKKNGLFGVVSKTGQSLLPFRYDSIDPVIYPNKAENNHFFVSRAGKTFVVDANGKELFEYHTKKIQAASNPKFWLAINENDTYQLLDKNGKTLIDEWFEYFEFGYFIIAYMTDGFRLYDQNLSLIYQSKQTETSPNLGNFPYFLIKENNQLLIKDTSGNTIGNYLSHWYDSLFYENNGVIYAKSGDKELILDEYNTIPSVVATIQGIDGFFLKHDSQLQFFDYHLRAFYSIDADSISHGGNVMFDEYGYCSYFIVGRNGKFALMLESGEFLTDFLFDEMKYMNPYGFIAVRKDHRWGVLNYRGGQVVDFMYDVETLVNDWPTDGNYADHYSFIGEWYQSYSTTLKKVMYIREHN